MIISNFNLSELPYVDLLQLEKLPTCSGIYFATDSQDRILYVGLSVNLAERWKDHHRLHQLQEIHKNSPVRISWLVWTESDLSTVEKYFIDRYQPLLNKTKVKSKTIIPSEVTLRELLKQIRLLTIVIGVKSYKKNELTTIYLKYDYENSGKNGCATIIKNFKKDLKNRSTNLQIKRSSYGEYRTYNVRPGSRDHKTISRIKSSYNNHWEIACNGVIIDITPLNKNEFISLRNQDNSSYQKLAGIKIRAINNLRVLNIYKTPQSFNSNFYNLDIMKYDPIPLFWVN